MVRLLPPAVRTLPADVVLALRHEWYEDDGGEDVDVDGAGGSGARRRLRTWREMLNRHQALRNAADLQLRHLGPADLASRAACHAVLTLVWLACTAAHNARVPGLVLRPAATASAGPVPVRCGEIVLKPTRGPVVPAWTMLHVQRGIDAGQRAVSDMTVLCPCHFQYCGHDDDDDQLEHHDQYQQPAQRQRQRQKEQQDYPFAQPPVRDEAVSDQAGARLRLLSTSRVVLLSCMGVVMVCINALFAAFYFAAFVRSLVRPLRHPLRASIEACRLSSHDKLTRKRA